MPMDKIMPDDMNEVACAMLAYIGEQDRQAGAKMSYGDFGKFLAKDYGENPHGFSGPDECSIEATRKSIRITTLSGNEYELTWNKIAKFIHPYLKSTTVSETVETDTPTDLQNMTAAVTNTTIDIPTFDYSTVDDDTADFLRKATDKIVTNLSLILSSQADIGAILIEARDRLANHYHGGFEKWYRSLGMSKSSVNRLIQVREFRENLLKSSQLGQLTDDPIELFDSLPKMLQSDISSPSAPAEAVNAVLSGDITTHKDYIALKKRIEELEEELEDERDSALLLEGERTKFFKRSEELKAEKEKLHREYHKEIERANSERHNAKEQAAKCKALEAELRELRSRPVETVAIEKDPKESQEYRSLKDDYDKIAQQVIATTQERDHLRERCDELYHQTQETPAPVYVGGADIEEIEKFTDELAGSIDAAVITFFRYYKEGSSKAVKDIFRRKADYIKTRIDNLAIMYLDDDD